MTVIAGCDHLEYVKGKRIKTVQKLFKAQLIQLDDYFQLLCPYTCGYSQGDAVYIINVDESFTIGSISDYAKQWLAENLPNEPKYLY